ncbi:MAG: response regulator, partial [Cyanobacteria bacterium P01_H01_bin.58]
TELGAMSANLFVLLHQDTFQIRLEIARCCSSTLLSPGISAQEIVDNVLEEHRRRALSNFRVLALDDDPVILNVLGQHLTSWGMLGTTLNDPGLLWDSLSQFNPDLLLLDVEMPNINGIELCRVIRSDRTWSHLPIVFLTTCRDSETVQAIYQAGADDYITKPFAAKELAARIVNRLVRNHSK